MTGGVSTRTPQERFWEKVNKTGGCWLWTAARQKNGYGSFYLDGKRVGAHRVVWEFERGLIPAGMVPDHTCLVKSCVNPDHLVPVTHGKNTALHYDRQATCRNGHPRENSYTDGRGWRVCRDCEREKRARRNDAEEGAK